MNTNKPLSKLMALVLSIALVFTMIPFTVFAEVVGCNHEHDETCGYVEGAECGHEHDGNCAEDGAECDHTQHDEACGYIEAAPCGHVHDANCGGLSLGDSGAVIVAAFDELDEYTLYQGYDYGVIQSQDDLILPDTLTGTDADDNPITIEGVTWESEPAFDPAVSIAYPGYIFSPVLPEGYILAEGVAAPVIAAIIRPGDLLPNPLAASVNIGTNGVLTVDRTGTATGSRVYYGGTVWRVVSIGSGEVTLFKEGSVGNRIFDPSSNDWSTSEICAWLNGTGSFTTDGYLPTTFTARESAIIQNYGLSPENQKIVLPSEAEVQDGGTWGFTDNADRRANYPSNSWWLRTPGDTGYTKTVSNVSGAISNSYVNNNLIVVRPAFKLRTSDILFTSMPGSKNSVQTGRELSPAAAITGAVKLTVLDSGLALTGATLTSVAERTINFSYSGATAGSTLSAVVKSSTGALKYYGQLATNIGTSGTASVTVPEDFASGDTLSVFVEEVNSSTATDYASALLPITFTDNPTAPTGVGKVDCTSANNDGQITGVNNTMEYKLASASAWTAITGTQITGLAPGTYYVRYAANGTTLASPYVAVVIASYTWADSGNGTSGTPYIIKTEAQLRAFAAYVNAGNTFNSGGRYVKLGNDIALSSAEWTPIGYDISNNYLNFYFGGYFDGDGHSVTGMNINATIAPNQYAYLGLFGYTNGGYIKNLRVEGSINATITNSRYLYTGGLEGRRDTGQVENCSADVSICLEATSSAGVSGGGLIGYIADGTISGSFATGDVTVKSNSDVARAGGLVGYAYTSSINISISNCYATGNVNAGSSSGSTYAGGFAALINNRTISNCYATGETSATSGGTKYAGGFAGDVTSGGTLSNCSFIGTGSGVGNGTATATGLTMAQMTDDNALTTMSLSTSDWSKRAASGNYVYRPELTAFYNAIPSTTQQLASEASARVLAAVIEAPVITSADSATFTVGTSGSFTVTATNSPTSFAIGGDTLPSGVTFNTATGVLSGTPASGTAATYHLTFTATNAGGTSSPQSFTLTVAAALTDITAAAVSITAPVTGATPQGTITAGTGYTGTISWSGSPASFVSSTVYTATVTLTSTAGYQFAATVPAASITGTNGTVGTPSTSGTGTGNTLTFTVTYPQTAALVPTITSASSTTFTEGTSGSFTVTATNSPTSFAIGGDTLPSGVTFNITTGVLSGTPATGTNGTYNLTFTATNAGGASSPQTFTLTVVAPTPGAPVITSASSTTFTEGTSGSFTVTATNSPTSFAIGGDTLPTGVTFNTTTGILSGTPASGTAATYNLTFTATNAGGASSPQTFTLTVAAPTPGAPVITSASSTTFTEGTSGSFTVTATNSPTSFAIGGDTLPSGVTFNTTTGVLSGTPASGTAATYNLTFTATNAGGTSSPQTFTLTVVAPTIYTITFNANGGSVSPTSMQTGADGKLASLPMPTRSGSYSFNGWYTASSGGTQITTSYVFTANTTIYAQWTYTGGGGGGGSSSPSYNITTDKQPNMPKVSTMTYAGTVQNNCLTCTITKSMIQAAVNKAGTDPDGIALAFVITNGGSYHCQTISIAGDALDLLKSSGVNYVLVQTDIFRFQFDSAAISSLDSQTAGTVAVSADPVSMLSGAASAAIGNRPAFGFTVKDSAGKTVTSYGSGTVTRGIKYTAVSTEKTGSLFIVKIVDGKVQWIDKSSYDNGWIIWSGDSNAVYGVGYKTPAPAFTDTANHWAKDDIDFVASHDLISGTSATTFFPDTAITRATFLMALGKLSGADVSGYTASSFTDVPDTNPAMPYIEWAVKNNIVQGIGDNKFGPDSLITREQMAVMMMGYAKATGYTLPVSQQATTFADDAKISSWAKEAVKAIQQTGVISGKPNNLFDPQGSATRAEAATILRRFVELVIDEGAARGWVQNDAGQWQYINTYGNAVTGWLNTEANKYWFDDKGIMAADKWVQISGKWYYFYADGKLAVNVTIDGYTVGADGARKE